MLNRRVRADLALVLCTFIWGATFVVDKDALADISVLAFLAVRFGLAAILMAVMFRRSITRLDKRGVWAGAQIGLFMFGGFVFQTAGLRWTTPSKAAFITGSSVVLVPLFLAAFGWRRITPWTWAAVAIAFGGLYFLTVPREGFLRINRGDPVVFVCAILFAMQIILISRYVERSSVGGLSFLQVAATAALSILALPIAAEWAGSRRESFGTATWFLLSRRRLLPPRPSRLRCRPGGKSTLRLRMPPFYSLSSRCSP